MFPLLILKVKLTIAIEDPRDVERKRLQGIDESDGPSREDLVTALEEVSVLPFFLSFIMLH